MFNRKASTHDENLIKDLRKQLKERDERIQALSSALTDAHETVRDLEDALDAAGATIGAPNPQTWRDSPMIEGDNVMHFRNSILNSPTRSVTMRSFQKDAQREMSVLTQSGVQPPMELSATFLDSQHYLFNSNINSEPYDLVTFREDLQNMQNQLAAKDRQIDDLLVEAEKWKMHVKTVNAEYDAFRRTILDMSMCNADLRTQLAQVTKDLEDSRATIESLVNTNREHEHAYKSLMTSMESHEKMVEILATVGQRPRGSRKSPMESPTAAEKDILQEIIQGKDKEITRLHEVLAEKEAEIARLVSTCEESVQMRNEIQSLLDQSIQTNQLLKEKIETMNEEARLASVQTYQNATSLNQAAEFTYVAQMAVNHSVPYPIYLRSSMVSKDGDLAVDSIIDKTAIQMPQSLVTSFSEGPAPFKDITTLLVSKDEEIEALKKRVQTLEKSLLTMDNQQSASQRASPAGSRGLSPKVGFAFEPKRGLLYDSWGNNAYSNNNIRSCFSEVSGGVKYLKLMKRTRTLIDEASDVLSGVGGRRNVSTSISVVSADDVAPQINAVDIHVKTINELRDANAQIISKIIEKDDQIADMLEIMINSEAELTDIKIQIEEKDRSFAQLTEDLHRKDRELDALVKEVKSAFAEVMELTNTVRARDALIKDLSEGLTESQDLIRQLADENSTLVKKMNEKNAELEKLLKDSTRVSIDLIKIRDQGSISKEDQARLLHSVKDSISFIERCTKAALDGNEDEEGNITEVTNTGARDTIASPMLVSNQCDVIVRAINYLTSKTEELRLLSNSYAAKHTRLAHFLDELAGELASVQTFATLLPPNSQLHLLMARLSEAIETDLQEARETLRATN